MEQELLYVLRRLVEHSLPDGAEKHHLLATVEKHMHAAAAPAETPVEEEKQPKGGKK